VDALVRKHCAEGVTMQYDRIPIGGHVTVAVQGAPGALAYVHDRPAGRPAARNC
jgi:hypothetical protein